MRTNKYTTEKLVSQFNEHLVLTLPDIKLILGTKSTMTVHRKLSTIGYQARYSHSGKYYTLLGIAEYDSNGLWEFNSIYFSKYGKLSKTIIKLVESSPAGYFAAELKQVLKVFVHNELRSLYHQHRLTREQIGREFLYLSKDTASQQLQQRKDNIQQAALENKIKLESSKNQFDEKEHLLVFLSILNEKQRRLFLGFESLRMGHGGDKAMSTLSGIDARTIAKGRQELLSHNISIDRVRAAGAGRPSLKKN